MPRKWKSSLSLCLALLFVLVVGAEAQTAETSQSQLPASVTASIAVERARFTAPAGVAEMRLEVFTAAGEKVFDSDFKPGNLLDWPFQDQQGQRLADGVYRCVITTKDLSGRLAEKRGEVRLQAGAETFEEASDQTQTAQERGSSNAMSREAFLTILRDGLTRATTVLAHDGEKGRLVSGSGGLSFRAGDFFAGKDVERMRLTPEGNLGIGLSNPQARLDVAGVIRAGEGVMFPDGTIQTTAANASKRDEDGSESGKRGTDESESKATRAAPPNGSGTTNRVTKWLDGPAGVVGDSAITEAGAKVGIGTSSPTSRLHVFGAGNQGIAIQNSEPGGRQWVLQSSVRASGGQFDIIDMTGGMYGLSILSNGNAGIGTTSPTAKLTVTGMIETTSGGVKFPDGTVQTTRGLSAQAPLTLSANFANGGTIEGLNSNPNTAINGAGVHGQGNGGTGVRGVHTGTTGAAPGVKGETYSADAGAAGVLGKVHTTSAAATNTAGVSGVNNVGIGVDGFSSTGAGVNGFSSFGNGVVASGYGAARDAAALRAVNHNASQGMAAYLTNGSNLATAHLANFGGGEVLRLQANGGPFIRAVNNNESKTVFSVNYDGTTVTNVLQITGGADFAEHFEVSEAPEAGSSPPIQPGLVVSIDPANPGKLVVSSQAYDRRVAGIISGAGGVKPGMTMSQAGSIADGHHPVALSGRVYCWVDASNEPIEPGDLLTSSNIPGHAMKVTDHAKAQGAIIGKAMTGLKDGKGLVLVLVTLQ